MVECFIQLILIIPCTPYWDALDWWTVASTAPSLTFPFNSVAALAQWGAKFLQWPHQGAKNSTNHKWSEFNTNLSKLLSVNSITSFLSEDWKINEVFLI